MGAHIFRLPTGPNSMINLGDLLTYLADKGINTLMVEGGAQIIANFLASRLVDQIIVTIAPVVVGGLRVVDNVNLFQSNNFPRLGHLFYQQVGGDLVVRGEPSWPAS
jgi:riboflavin biosynthesis pyrimidine reductase